MAPDDFVAGDWTAMPSPIAAARRGRGAVVRRAGLDDVGGSDLLIPVECLQYSDNVLLTDRVGSYKLCVLCNSKR